MASTPDAAGDQQTVLTEQTGGTAVVTLNRPRQRNALRYETWTELGDVFRQAAGKADVRAIVLTGAAGFFSAGGDLKSGPAHGTGPLGPAGRVEHAQQVLHEVRALPVPVIAAVEGGAVGLAWSLVLSCDLVIAASDAFFSAPFVARAVVPDGGLAWQLTEQLGRHRAADLLLRGARLTAQRAESLGLVTEVVEPGSALTRGVQIAQEFATAEPGALEMTKRLLTAAGAAGLAAFEPLELAMAVVAQQRSASSLERSRYS